MNIMAEAEVFVVDLEHIQAELKENIAQAQERYQKNADKHRLEAPKLNVRDQAYVKVKFFRTRQCKCTKRALSTPTVHTMDREKEGGKDSLSAKVGLLSSLTSS